ncbi:16453_t:CDS:1, partial [Cetraspora pellucida]
QVENDLEQGQNYNEMQLPEQIDKKKKSTKPTIFKTLTTACKCGANTCKCCGATCNFGVTICCFCCIAIIVAAIILPLYYGAKVLGIEH